MGLLPGQQIINGYSSFVAGTNMPPDYNTHTVRNTPQIQALIKSAGFTLMRCAIPDGSADSYIDETANACVACGCAMLVILNKTDLTWNQHLVSYLGSRCNLYEFSNEPDLSTYSWSQYLSAWNQHIPLLRGINSTAAYIGPALGVYANVDSYLIPWLQGCKTSGVIPDGISYHIYPCTGQTSSTICTSKTGNIANTVSTMNSKVSSVLGYTLPLCMTEWNIDANNPVQPYVLDASFTQPWITACMDSLFTSGFAMCCQFDAGSGAAGGADDLVNTSTYQPQIEYQPMADAIKKYLGSSSGGITASPTSLSFSGPAGGSNPANQTVTVSNTGSAPASYTASTAFSWISISPTSGSINPGSSATSTISINTSGLAAGTYNGSVTYSAGGSTATVNVTLTLTSTGVTALTLYTANAAASTVATSDQLYTTGGTPTTTWKYSRVGTATGYGEITSQGTTSAWAAAGSIGSPTGKGFLYDSTNLEGQQFAAANWSGSVRLNCAQNGDTSPQAGSLTADIIVRVYKRSSSGTYTPIVSMTAAAQSLTASYTTFSLPSTAGSSVSFTTGDKLYIDIWLKVTTNQNGSSVQDVRLNRLSTDVSGHTGDTNSKIVSPGYSASGGSSSGGITASPTSLSFSGPAGGSNPANQTVTVSNTGSAPASYTASTAFSWISISPTSGSINPGSSATSTISINTSGLAAGTYNGSVTYSAGGSTATVNVTLAALGNQGLQGGWVISDQGAINFPHSLQSQLPAIQEAGAGWVRIGFRLGSCYSDWTSTGCNGTTALDQYDQVIDDAQSRGLHILGLINNESWPGGQSLWTANNAENAGGNGDNPYMQALSQNAAVVLATHYSGIINTWEVWNEPNAWTANPSPGVYTGGSYIYPSNFAWLLRHVYEDTRNAGLTGLTFISGGIFSHDIGGSFSSGSDYITATYNQGLANAGWRSVKQALGSYPLDALGQHIYIDQGGTTSSTKMTQYLQAVRNAYVAFEGTSTAKKTVITEVGWTTASVSQSTQANNLKIAYSTFKQTPYVNNAYWFNIQDVPEASLYFGLETGDGVHKLSFSTYQQYAHY